MPFRKSLPLRARRSPEAGVTLIEMMIVLVIIGVVAAIVVPNVVGRPDQARATVAETDMRTIAASLEMYRLDNRSYPTTEQGLAALAAPPTQPPLAPNWVQGGYMRTVPTDPWGRPYVYRSPAQDAGFVILSLGADGTEGGEGVDADLRVSGVAGG
jgi:general secretion pathway protein G